VSRGIIKSNPCDGISPPSEETARDRVLSLDELHLVWNATDRLGFPFGPITKLLILTGQRRSEVGDMEWNEIDVEKCIWTIPAVRSKNKRQHVVPLSPEATEIIHSLPRFAGSKFLFSSGDTPPSGFSKAKVRLDKLIAEANGEPIPPFVLHDLRRSAASGMAAIGIDLHVIERALNHISGSFSGIVGVYQRHKYEDDVRRALEAWARQIVSLINKETGNIVELVRA
jgi:integrase